MFEQVEFRSIGRNVIVYLVGVALSVVGALGLAEAIELSAVLATGLFVTGLAVVLFVHEVLDGPF